MEKLMKPAEYAKELGISRQAVYAKIKRGGLTAKSVEGKLYIVVDNVSKEEPTKSNETSKQQPTAPQKTVIPKSSNKEYEKLLLAKDETINVLKGTVKDLKKTNKQMSTTLRGEIDLLKQAFHEMRSLYVHQIEQMKPQHSTLEEMIEVDSVHSEEGETLEAWVGVKKFLKQQNITKKKALKRLKKAFKKGDERLMKIDGKLKIDQNKNYEDILN